MNVIEALFIESPGGVSILINAAMRGFFILLATTVLALCIRKASAARRHLLWTLALSAACLMPLFSYGFPSINLPLLSDSVTISPESPTPVRLTNPAPTLAAATDSMNLAPIPTGPSHPPTPQQRETPFSWQDWLLAIWVAGFALCLIPLVTGLLSLTFFNRRCRPLEDRAMTQRVARLSQQLNITQPISIVRSGTGRSRAVPSVWGMTRPILYWPACSQQWDPAQIESVLLHELAHIKRRDWMTQIACTLFCASHWFNPLAWLALHRIRLESEKACDDLVLEAGVQHPAYAQHLLTVARNSAIPQLGAPMTLAMARTSEIEERLRDILNPTKSHRGISRGTLVLGVTIAALISIPVATLRAIAKPEAKVESIERLPQLSGRITLGEDGEAASGVRLRITVFEKDAWRSYPLASRILTTRCDANGHFVAKLPSDLQIHTLMLESLLPGYCIRREIPTLPHFVDVEKTLYRNDGELADEIRLMPSDYIAGRVVDEEGKGLPGVAIGATLRDASSSFSVQSLKTDKDGRFEIYRFPLDHSAYTLGLISFKRDGMIPINLDDVFDMPNERKRNLDIVMSRGHSVSGTLVDADGNAAADVLVSVRRFGKKRPTGRSKSWTFRKAVKTNSKGAFVLTGIKEGEHEILAINVSTLQKTVIEKTIDQDVSDLSLRLSPMILPAETRPIEVLGMKVINVNDIIRDVFPLGLSNSGVLVLDPGDDTKRFQIGDLQPGDCFVNVGNEGVKSVIDFISMLLESVTEEHGHDLSALPSTFRSNTRVVYSLRRAWGQGVNTQYIELNKADMLALQAQVLELPKTHHSDIYPNYIVEHNMANVMLRSFKAARWSYRQENDSQLPNALEDLKPHLLDEHKIWLNAESVRSRRKYGRVDFYQWLTDNAVLYFPKKKESAQKYDGSILGYCHSMLRRHGKTCVIYNYRGLHSGFVSREDLEKQLKEQGLLLPSL